MILEILMSRLHSQSCTILVSVMSEIENLREVSTRREERTQILPGHWCTDLRLARLAAA